MREFSDDNGKQDEKTAVGAEPGVEVFVVPVGGGVANRVPIQSDAESQDPAEEGTQPLFSSNYYQELLDKGKTVVADLESGEANVVDIGDGTIFENDGTSAPSTIEYAEESFEGLPSFPSAVSEAAIPVLPGEVERATSAVPYSPDEEEPEDEPRSFRADFLCELPYFLDSAAYYASIISWIGVLAFAIGMFAQNGVMRFAGAVIALAMISVAVLGDELSRRAFGKGRGMTGWFSIIAVISFDVMAVIGFVLEDPELLSGGAFGVFFVQFIPSIYDYFHDSYGEDDEDVYYQPRRRSYSLSAYGDVFEMFGVKLPPEPPAIVIENGQDYDDELEKEFGVKLDKRLDGDGVPSEPEPAEPSTDSDEDVVFLEDAYHLQRHAGEE